MLMTLTISKHFEQYYPFLHLKDSKTNVLFQDENLENFMFKIAGHKDLTSPVITSISYNNLILHVE
jgi:hypothetical protein